MKTLKTIIPLIALVISCSLAKATGNDDEGKLTRAFAINTYIDAVTNGKTDGLSEVVDNNTKFCNLLGKNMSSYSKNEMLTHLAALKNVKQACTTTSTIVEENASVSVIRVDMKYENFTRSNYVTIARCGNGWKITNVCSVFK